MRDIRFAAKIIGKFKSIQSAIFAVVTVLLLSAVLVITGVSMRYTQAIHILKILLSTPRISCSR